MKYYRDTLNNIFAYELDCSQDELIGDKIEMTLEEIELHINPPITLAQAKEDKRNEIRSAFNAQSELPVLVGTVSYSGGFDSAIKLDGAKRMVESAGGLEVTFFDVDNLPHVLTLVEAQEVILTIGADYQTKFANKQAKMVQVENATTIEEVNNVSM